MSKVIMRCDKSHKKQEFDSRNDAIDWIEKFWEGFEVKFSDWVIEGVKYIQAEANLSVVQGTKEVIIKRTYLYTISPEAQ